MGSVPTSSPRPIATLRGARAPAEDLALFTTNPDDYTGLEKLLRVIPVTRPSGWQEKKP
jgi:hypothetical protein